jgi:phosphoglycolate phosphatase-like HAD superfamily hydrolase
MKQTPNVTEVLSEIDSNHDQILISNTRQASLEMTLKLLDLEYFFAPDRAFAVDRHVPTATITKRDVLSQYLAANDRFEDLVIIGDSPSDMRLSEVAGGKTYLYAHPGFPFRECAADFKIRDLRAVLAHV